MTANGFPPVMILGCGRSGTSIFGELFESVAGYQYKSEPAFSEVVETDFQTPWAFKVPRESEGYPPDPGLSFPLATLRRRVPAMHYFWIVRHPARCDLFLEGGNLERLGASPEAA